MELLTILDKIAKETEMAGRKPEEFPVQTRDGWLVRISQAKKRLEDLRVLYAQTFFNEATPLFLSGTSVSGIGKLIEGYESGVYVHADQLYEDIADQIEKLLGPQRQWLTDMSNAVNAMLADILHQAGATSFIRVVPDKASFVVRDRKELGDLIKKWIVKANGNTPSLYYLCRIIREKALNNRISTEAYVVIDGLTKEQLKEWQPLFKKSGHFEVGLNGDPKKTLSDVISKYQERLKNDTPKRPKKTTGRD